MTSLLKRKRHNPEQSKGSRSSKIARGKNLKSTKDGVSASNPVAGLEASVNEKDIERIDNGHSISPAPISLEDISVRTGVSHPASLVQESKGTAEMWYLSPPIGGRMIKSDPVFSADEKYVGAL